MKSTILISSTIEFYLSVIFHHAVHGPYYAGCISTFAIKTLIYRVTNQNPYLDMFLHTSIGTDQFYAALLRFQFFALRTKCLKHRTI